MFEVKIKFETVEDVEDFHKMVCNMNCDVDALCGSYIVDAKSFVGLCTVAHAFPLKVVVHSNDLALRKGFEKWM